MIQWNRFLNFLEKVAPNSHFQEPYQLHTSKYESISFWAKFEQNLHNNRFDDSDLFVFDCSGEGYYMWELLYGIHIKMKKYKIPSNRVVFMNGDYNIKENYNKWLDGKYDPITTEQYIPIAEGFEPFHTIPFDKIFIINQALTEDVKHKLKIRSYSEERNKLFISLNRNGHDWRKLWIKNLRKYNLFDKGYVSWIPDGITFEKDYLYNYEYDDHGTQPNPVSWSPEDLIKMKKYYDDSWFSVVTESQCKHSDVLYCTEKIYKPIIYGQPFMTIGPVGILEHLKGMGYETFEGLFDESYDSDENWKGRTNHVSLETKRIFDNFDKIDWVKYEEITTHNQNVFLTTTKPVDDVINEFLKIREGLV